MWHGYVLVAQFVRCGKLPHLGASYAYMIATLAKIGNMILTWNSMGAAGKLEDKNS